MFQILLFFEPVHPHIHHDEVCHPDHPYYENLLSPQVYLLVPEHYETLQTWLPFYMNLYPHQAKLLKDTNGLMRVAYFIDMGLG